MNIHPSTFNHPQSVYSHRGDPYHFVRPTGHQLPLPQVQHQHHDAPPLPLTTSLDGTYHQPTPTSKAQPRVVIESEGNGRSKRYRSPPSESSRGSSISMDSRRHRRNRQSEPEPEPEVMEVIPENGYKRIYRPYSTRNRPPIPAPAPARAMTRSPPVEGRRHSSRCQCHTCRPPVPRSSGNTHTRISSPAPAPVRTPAPARPATAPAISHKKTTPATSAARRAVVSKFAEEVEEEMTCPICMSVMVVPHQITPCGHALCGSCGVTWLQTRASTGDAINCPTCRETVDQRNPLTPARNLENMIGKWVENKLAVEGEWEGMEDYEDRKERWAIHKAHNPEGVFPIDLLQQRGRNEEHPANIMFRESPSGVGAPLGPLWDIDELFNSVENGFGHGEAGLLRMRNMELLENFLENALPHSHSRSSNRPPPTGRDPETVTWPRAGDYFEQEYQNGNGYRDRDGIERGRAGEWTHQGMPRGFNMPDMFDWLRQRGPSAASSPVGAGGMMPPTVGIGLSLFNNVDRNRSRRAARPPLTDRRYGGGSAGEVSFDPVEWQWR